ncbi:hypothetical protein A2W32_01670 [candidate division WWE3 bacterium RBG_16_37_10]|uniref:Uncharacterized protein n=1 Tax=candidate division WWE3 bacterium RBG_16_37_10 TaxID=1802610 RepID=A0A1F4USV5_UNCKA|nr:MAG: hypothetical protein A2W32_01670 [candidate division WWE3 bacterium RBG_16_37_10]
MELRTILITILVITTISLVGYKYYEYQQLLNLIKTVDENAREELLLVEEEDKLSKQAFQKFNEYISSWNSENFVKLNEQEKIDKTNEYLINIINAVKFSNNKSQEYKNAIIKNSEEILELKSAGKLLIGNRKNHHISVTDFIGRYYYHELEAVNTALVEDILSSNWLEAEKDMLVTDQYELSTKNSNEQTYKDYFFILSPLEKYNRNDFTFSNDNLLIQDYPYGYEVLQRYKRFLKSYYQINRDFISGDYESVNYKASKLEDDAVNTSTIDWNKFVNENNEKKTELRKKILDNLINLLKLIKEFDNLNLGNYPFVESINYSIFDITMCNAYMYKTSLYSDISGENIKAQTFEELLKELSILSPKTEYLDVYFDKDTLNYKNSENKFLFNCLDKTTNKNYLFTLSK